MKTYKLSLHEIGELKSLAWTNLGADDRLYRLYEDRIHTMTHTLAVVDDKGEGKLRGRYNPFVPVTHVLWCLDNFVLDGKNSTSKLAHIMHSGKRSGDNACITLVVENDNGRYVDIDLYVSGEVLIGWTDWNRHSGVIETSWDAGASYWTDNTVWGSSDHWTALSDFLKGNRNNVV